MRHLATRRIKGGHGPGRPGPEVVESAGREPEYAAANIRSQDSQEQEPQVVQAEQVEVVQAEQVEEEE
jgi:hypothetical protein